MTGISISEEVDLLLLQRIMFDQTAKMADSRNWVHCELAEK